MEEVEEEEESDLRKRTDKGGGKGLRLSPYRNIGGQYPQKEGDEERLWWVGNNGPEFKVGKDQDVLNQA